MDFMNRVAVITGGAGGIGSATARLFAERGATVVIADLDGARAASVAESITNEAAVRDAGGSAHGIACDVTDEEQVNAAFDGVASDHGRFDVLVNNAGIIRDNLIHKMTMQDWTTVIQTNLTSTFVCSSAAQRLMVPNRYGKIVNVSSRSALGNRGQTNYAAAKAGIQGLTATLAIELGRFNINVNAVAPGFIATAMTDSVAERVGAPVDEYHAQVAAATPLGRVGAPQDVAEVIAFLASDKASYVSGQTLYINGGAR